VVPPDLAQHGGHLTARESPRRVEVRASTPRPGFPGDAPVDALCEGGLPQCSAQSLNRVSISPRQRTHLAVALNASWWASSGSEAMSPGPENAHHAASIGFPAAAITCRNLQYL